MSIPFHFLKPEAEAWDRERNAAREAEAEARRVASVAQSAPLVSEDAALRAMHADLEKQDLAYAAGEQRRLDAELGRYDLLACDEGAELLEAVQIFATALASFATAVRPRVAEVIALEHRAIECVEHLKTHHRVTSFGAGTAPAHHAVAAKAAWNRAGSKLSALALEGFASSEVKDLSRAEWIVGRVVEALQKSASEARLVRLAANTPPSPPKLPRDVVFSPHNAVSRELRTTIAAPPAPVVTEPKPGLLGRIASAFASTDEKAKP